MNENLKIQKICPSCNHVNKGSNNYCRICGASLEGIEATKLEGAPISNDSETNKVEIIKDYKASKYGNICCVILIPFVIIGFMILGLSINPIVFGAFLIIFIFTIPIVICGLIQVLRMKASYGRTREFSISDQEIMIKIPNRFTFKIKWSQFNTVQVFKTIGSDYGVLIYSSCSDYYHFHFFSNDLSVGNFVIETDVDFSKSDVKKIKSLIEQYAHRLNKDYRWGKKGLKEKIKGKHKIPMPSIPVIQTIPEVSNQMPISQTHQIDVSSTCPYCGNTEPKIKTLTWGKFIFGYLCVFPILIWIISWFFLSSSTYFVLYIIIIICVITGIINAIKRYDNCPIKCPQCLKEFTIKRKPQKI